MFTTRVGLLGYVTQAMPIEERFSIPKVPWLWELR
jgi:hypothetical protein